MVNDIDLSEDLVTVDGDQVVMGAKSFQQTVTTNNLTAPYINGVDIQWLYDHAVVTENYASEQPVNFYSDVVSKANATTCMINTSKQNYIFMLICISIY